MNKDTARSEYTAGLRALADLLDGHPEVGLPWTGSSAIANPLTFYTLGQDDSAEQAAVFARAFPGHLDKKFDEKTFRLIGRLHGLHVALVTYRSDVCERVVTGTREVTNQVPVEFRDVTETVEDVAWICNPILAEQTA